MTSPEGGPGRTRRRLLWAGLGGVILIGVLAVAIVAALPIVDPVKDTAGLALVRERLSAARDDVNGVTDPPSSRANGAANVTGCSVDSGEVFEPALFREWRLLGPARSAEYDQVTDAGRRAGSSVAAQLLERGWSGSPGLRGENYPFTELTKDYGDYRVTLSIQVLDDSILVSGSTKHPRVCRSHA